MNDRPEGYVVHRTPARLRVKVPKRRRDTSFFADAQRQLSDWPMVERVEISPVTASILIHADDSGACLETLKCGGPFLIVDADAQRGGDVVAFARRQLSSLDKELRRRTGGRLDTTRISVFLAFGMTIGFQLARGRRLSAAATALLFTGRALQRWRGAADHVRGDRAIEAAPSPVAIPLAEQSAQQSG